MVRRYRARPNPGRLPLALAGVATLALPMDAW